LEANKIKDLRNHIYEQDEEIDSLKIMVDEYQHLVSQNKKKLYNNYIEIKNINKEKIEIMNNFNLKEEEYINNINKINI